MTQIIGKVTFQLPGAVVLVNTPEILLPEEIEKRITSARNSPTGFADCEFCVIPSSNKTANLEAVPQSCVQELSITKNTYDAITVAVQKKKRNGKGNELGYLSEPSRIAMQEYGCKTMGDYARLSEYGKLECYYSDVAADLKATSLKIVLFPVASSN